jgi:hypothetical protein
MKLNDLKKIIKEEIAKVLAEAPQTAPAPTREKEKTKEKPSEDEDEWETPSITPEPKKANRPEAAKKISEKISKRYTDILKKKK